VDPDIVLFCVLTEASKKELAQLLDGFMDVIVDARNLRELIDAAERRERELREERVLEQLVNPFRYDSQSFGRRVFQVEDLPEGAIARYTRRDDE
jgi:hypothetical protein